MKRLNIILLILSLVAIMYGCSEENKDTAADPNVINRGESQYNITAELAADDTNKQSYQFGINLGGVMIENEADYYVKWDFGDTTTGEGLKPVHTYKDTGVYNVTAYISDNKTDTFKTSSVDIVSGTDPDIYNTNIVVYRANDRREFTFVASAVSASGEDLKYSWNFNDGSPITLAKKNNSVDHIFAKYGKTYNVILTVDNGKGGEGSKIEVPLDVTTELPDLAWACASGGPAYDNLNNLIGQYLNCQPNLTYGTILDVVYVWEYYSEIENNEYNPDNKSMIVVQDGIEIPYAESDPNKARYYALNGNGTSNVNDPISYIFKEGGRKFIKLEGSSQNYLTTNIKYAAELSLPNNAFLEAMSCAIDSGDKTGLTYTCSAKGYSMPKKADGSATYIAPLSVYNWSVRDQDGNLIDVEAANLVHKLTCTNADGTETLITDTNTGNFETAGYKYCTATVTYKASKYDVEPAYSTMVLDAEYYEMIEGEETSRIYLQQVNDFRVEAPKIQNIEAKQNPNSNKPLEFTFTASFDKTINASDVQYHWSFGDNTNVVTNTANTTHTFPNANGSYTVSVYATSSTFARTETASYTVQMNPEFRGSSLTVTYTKEGINSNIFTISSDYVAQIDGTDVETNYQLTISGGGYTRVFDIPAENINSDGGFSITTVEPTVENIKPESSVLAVPYSTPLNVQLTVSSNDSSAVMYATSVIPITNLSSMDWNQSNSFYLKKFFNSTQQVTNVSEFSCTYLLEYPIENGEMANKNLVNKVSLYVDGQTPPTEYINTLTVPCNTHVKLTRINGSSGSLYNTYVKIIVEEGPYISTYTYSTIRGYLG